MAFLQKFLEVKPSTLPGSGSGLFTQKAIAKGERIIEYTGKIRTWKEVQNEDDKTFNYQKQKFVKTVSFDVYLQHRSAKALPERPTGSFPDNWQFLIELPFVI